MMVTTKEGQSLKNPFLFHHSLHPASASTTSEHPSSSSCLLHALKYLQSHPNTHYAPYMTTLDCSRSFCKQASACMSFQFNFTWARTREGVLWMMMRISSSRMPKMMIKNNSKNIQVQTMTHAGTDEWKYIAIALVLLWANVKGVCINPDGIYTSIRNL